MDNVNHFPLLFWWPTRLKSPPIDADLIVWFAGEGWYVGTFNGEQWAIGETGVFSDRVPDQWAEVPAPIT